MKKHSLRRTLLIAMWLTAFFLFLFLIGGLALLTARTDQATWNTHSVLYLVGSGLFLLIVIISIGAFFLIQRNVLKAIDELSQGTEMLGRGEIKHHPNKQPYKEFEELAISINDMAHKLKLREEALKKAHDQAMQANRFKGQMLAHVSHDLRTPNNAILGYSELLEMDGTLNENQKASIERIVANSRRLMNIVNSLLDQSQLERGTFQVNFSRFSTKKLVENANLTAEPLTLAKELEFKVEIDETFPEIFYGDFERIQQILMNLLDNAIKFTEEGTISLRVFLPDKDYWAFSITDTGPGIAAEDQSIIFQPFRQLDDLATRKHGGVGLGLSIVQQLTLAMKGKVWVESEIGKGSKFTVILPMNPSEENPK